MAFYPEIGLFLEESFSVCPPLPIAFDLCRMAASCKAKTALDMGTGTGIVGIYLAKEQTKWYRVASPPVESLFEDSKPLWPHRVLFSLYFFLWLMVWASLLFLQPFPSRSL